VRSAGFDRVGFARARRSPDAEHFEAWLEAGHAADMDYLARNSARRCDPREVVPDAKTVIAVALHYHDSTEPAAASPPNDGTAYLSVYARGEDYHRVVEKRLRSISRELASRFDGQVFRYYVDTGPILERSWAQEAGIGWIGKNACAIDSDRGSYFFIGVIITTMAIEADEPAVNHCGTCVKCLEACPTSAFPAPFVLDSRRCISYLTIENRGETPGELAGEFGSMVFGCDICQAVCPFNRPEPAEIDAALAPDSTNQSLPLEELAELTDVEDFRARFPQSAVRRAKHHGFLRNVVIAIANSRRPALRPLIDKIAASTIGHQSPVKEAIAWARRKMG
jgi:epoxyqueuosine reductase